MKIVSRYGDAYVFRNSANYDLRFRFFPLQDFIWWPTIVSYKIGVYGNTHRVVFFKFLNTSIYWSYKF